MRNLLMSILICAATPVMAQDVARTLSAAQPELLLPRREAGQGRDTRRGFDELDPASDGLHLPQPAADRRVPGAVRVPTDASISWHVEPLATQHFAPRVGTARAQDQPQQLDRNGPSNPSCVYVSDCLMRRIFRSKRQKPEAGTVPSSRSKPIDCPANTACCPTRTAWNRAGAARDGVPGRHVLPAHSTAARCSGVSAAPTPGNSRWKYLGTCAYHGIVPPGAITGIVTWPHQPNIRLMLVWDLSVSLDQPAGLRRPLPGSDKETIRRRVQRQTLWPGHTPLA